MSGRRRSKPPARPSGKKPSFGITSSKSSSGYDAFTNLSSQSSRRKVSVSSNVSSSSGSTPRPPDDELEEARSMAERFHNHAIVMDAAGWLMKESKSTSTFGFGRTVKNKRFFRLVYDTQKLGWILRWYETLEAEEENLKPQGTCSLDTAKVKFVSESRAVTVGRMPSAVDVSVEFPSKKTYRLYTESTDPRAGANLISRVEEVVRLGAHNPDMPKNPKVIEYLYAEALDRNNIKQAVAAKMRQSMPLNQKWQYVIQSWTTKEDVTKGVLPWIEVVTSWPATIKRLLEDRDMVENELGKTIEDYASRRRLLSQKNSTMFSSLSTTNTDWGPVVTKARELVHHWKSMAQGFRPWLHTFAELNGIAKLVKTAAIFAGREVKTLRQVERAALNELVQLMYV
jgi:hypothetical protein